MKIKVRPDDFEVEELMRLRLNPRGKYSIYRLDKRLWNTLDVMDFVGRKYRLGNMQRAGLKDRYSHSVQYISAAGEGPRSIEEKNFRMRLVGRSFDPVSLDQMIGNRFRITLRDMTADEVTAIRANMPAVLKHGFPNYYDEQRFGSIRGQARSNRKTQAQASSQPGGKGEHADRGVEFIARKLILGHYNGALRLYMATPTAFDNAPLRKMKTWLSEHWGEWESCIGNPACGTLSAEFAPILRYLVQHPKDFEGALHQVRRDFLEMFLNSYQSYLWNETLSQLIMSFGLPTDVEPYSGGELLFYRELNPKARQFFSEHEIPAASPKTELDNERIARVLNTVLIREGLILRDMKLDLRIPGVFFKPFSRSGVVWPQKLLVSESETDELYAGHQKLTLSFVLPPGSYATMLVKRLGLNRGRPSLGDRA